MKDHRNNYATGTTVESDVGYSVVIGKPVVHAEKKATGSSVSFPCEAIHDGSYLVSLEVNGSVKAYRESMDFSSGSCTVGAYTLFYSSYALTVSGTSNNNNVRVIVEPLDVKTTDAFRAAVKKDAPKTPGGGSGGGSPLIVHCTVSNGEYVLSEDWDTINEAFTEDGRPVLIELTDPGTKSAVERHTYCLVTEVQSTENFVTEQRSIENASEAKSISGSDYYVVCTNLSNVDFNFKYLFHSDTNSGTLSCSEPLPIDGGGSTGGGVLMVHETVTEEGGEEVHTLDTTYADIAAGFCVLDIYDDGLGVHRINTLYAYGHVNGLYSVSFGNHTYATDSENGYPILQNLG